MIDWNRIDELRGEVGEEDFAQIAALFLAEMEAVVASLPATEAAAMPDLLHGLKGSAMNLGFADLAGLCAAGETRPPDRTGNRTGSRADDGSEREGNN